MSIGLPLTKVNLDNVLGMEIGAVWSALNTINVRNTWLNDASHNSSFMGSLGYTVGGSSEDATIRAAFTDLNKLWQISHAAATQGATNDFFFNAKLLGGINWYG